MIGIIGAMDIEVEPLIEKMTEKREEAISGLIYTSGKLEGKDVVIVLCGVGKVLAAICTQTMILRYGADVVLNTGVAGTVTDKLHIGDCAVAEGVIQHDMDLRSLGYQLGYICDLDMVSIPCDEKAVSIMKQCLEDAGIRYVSGAIASGDQFVGSTQQKNTIKEHFNAVACEMESAGVATACFLNNVPFTVIRAISDEANGKSSQDYPAFAKKAAENSVKVTLDFIRRYS